MPKQSNFRHYSLSQATRRTLKVSSFGGIDLSSQRFLAADARAIDAKNFVYRDGVVQKRHGWEDVARAKPIRYLRKEFDGTDGSEVFENGVSFNGIWRFDGEDGESHVIAHIGKLLFEGKGLLGDDPSFEPIRLSPADEEGEDGKLYPRLYEFEDYKSSAFVGGRKLWFLGGNKFMCLRFLADGSLLLLPVANGDSAATPTTTISITRSDAAAGQRMPLDSVSLLTMWRKNKLITGVARDPDSAQASEYADFTLDAPLVCKDEKKDMAGFSMSIEERGTVES